MCIRRPTSHDYPAIQGTCNKPHQNCACSSENMLVNNIRPCRYVWEFVWRAAGCLALL